MGIGLIACRALLRDCPLESPPLKGTVPLSDRDAGGQSPVAVVAAAEVAERVRAAIAALPRGQREAFVLVHLEGLSIAEAASASGRAVGTMKSHLHRALASLRTRRADLAPGGERSGATREETR